MNSITKSRVIYNRKAKAWQCINGKVSSFPPGKEGKRQALREALRSDHAELSEIVEDLIKREDNPEVTDRLLKASSLLTKGHVYSNGRVKSQEGEEVYSVTFDGIPKIWLCSCEDYAMGQARAYGASKWGAPESAYGSLCKHCFAMLLAWLSNAELQEQPIPFDHALALPASVDIQEDILDWLE